MLVHPARVGQGLAEQPQVPDGKIQPRGEGRGVAPLEALGQFDAAPPGTEHVVGEHEAVCRRRPGEGPLEPSVLGLAQRDVPQIAIAFGSMSRAELIIHRLRRMPVWINHNEQRVAPLKRVVRLADAHVLLGFFAAGVEAVCFRIGDVFLPIRRIENGDVVEGHG